MVLCFLFDGECWPDHGATVSSFVSIALSPAPLVAFALRLPSRLASHLNHASSSVGRRSNTPKPQAVFRIHLLSQEQENLARAFARQPLLPQKATPSSAASSVVTFAPFPKELFQELEETSLGSLDCTVTGRVHLTDPLPSAIGVQAESYAGSSDLDSSFDASQATSQLFIAKVLKARTGGEGKRKPLLYCGQNYRHLA
jgi:flavin reductase (DIM6/NTAB) family NADH-FMN oxidoreductase RutF